MEAEKEITLNDREELVFKILLDTVTHFGLDIIVRAAGGWVRDKLLEVESDDIDIVVDKVSGEEFAMKVSQYMTESSMVGCSRIGVVKQNPDQSKHLATACFSLNGISLDVNNLRTETYAADSRIPQVSIGTASEDAHRRDFTINALFYNLNTGSIEDFVGTGREDLRAGIIRTPLPPRETFLDDPLRLLRAIRFAARLDYTVHDDILEVVKDPNMAKLLFTKVSRERIGIEIDKMLTAGSQKPMKALQLLDSMGLLAAVFMPNDLNLGPLIGEVTPQPADLLMGLARAKLASALLGPEASKQDIRLIAYTGLLSPWRSLRYKEKSRHRPLAHGILRAGLRLPNELSELVPTLANAAYGFLEVYRASLSDHAEHRRKMGEHVRTAKELWPLALALCTAMNDSTSAAASDLSSGHAGFSNQNAKQEFEERSKWLQDSGLIGCWSWRPLIDGKRLMEPPFSIPRGPRLGTLIEQQIQWRLEDPGFDEAACKRRLLDVAKS